MVKPLQYFIQKLSALGSVIDELRREMEADQPTVTPRKRQNLKEERVMAFTDGK